MARKKKINKGGNKEPRAEEETRNAGNGISEEPSASSNTYCEGGAAVRDGVAEDNERDNEDVESKLVDGTADDDEMKQSCCRGKKNEDMDDTKISGEKADETIAAESPATDPAPKWKDTGGLSSSCCTIKGQKKEDRNVGQQEQKFPAKSRITAVPKSCGSSKEPPEEEKTSCGAIKKGEESDADKSAPPDGIPPKSPGSCCKTKKDAETGTGTSSSKKVSASGSAPIGTCCGCGDNFHCCIENGWSKCQCEASCCCSDPLLSEKASLVLECTGQTQPTEECLAPSSSIMEAEDPLKAAPAKAPSDNDLEAQKSKSPVYVDIVVGGMTCTMCSQAIINVLQMMDSVLSVNVSLTTDVAHVEIDPQHQANYELIVEEVQEKIQSVGYIVMDVMTMPNYKELSVERARRSAGNGDDGNGEENTSLLNSNPQQDRWDRIGHRQKEKLRGRKRDFLWSVAGTLPIVFITMVLPHVLPHLSSSAAEWWRNQQLHVFHRNIRMESFVLWLFATPVQFICGWEFYKSSYYGLFCTGSWGMDVLISLGTTASYGYALYATWTNQPQESHFFETSAVLISFVLLGKWMQALAVHRTSDALSQLMKLQPPTAIRVVPVATVGSMDRWDPLKEAYREETVATNELKRGDVVKIIPGSSLPADGIVIVGELSVDESMVTGESLPVLKTKGSVVLGGTVCVEGSALNEDAASKNENKSIDTTGQVAFCRVTGIGSCTALAQIIQLVQDAQASKVPMQNFADTVSSIFVPVVVTMSVITFLVWYALCSSGVVPERWYDDLGEDAATFSLMFSIATIVISCPCALGLATPTAIMVGTGVGARLGILMKGGEALEAASKVNAVVLDKTGTVTSGKPAVTDFVTLSEEASRDIYCTKKGKKETPSSISSKVLSKETILWLLGSLERSSEHPLAKAIVLYAEQGLSEQKRNGVTYLEENPFLQPSGFRSLTGRGASGFMTIERREGTTQYFVALGNRAFFSSLDMAVSEQTDVQMKQLEEQGKTAILGAIDNRFCVVLGVADQLRADAARSVAYLRRMKIDVWMVTGDNARTAQAIAQQLNLPPQRVVSEALPNAKVYQVKKLQQQGKIVAMAGDGTNDAPALAQANVGIGMGAGTAIAAEAADMVLVRGQYMTDVCTALDLSRVIFARIQWNFLWSLIYNCLGIPLAAGVCFPLVHRRLPPTVAALAMALSSVSVVFNSLALRLYKPPLVAQTSPTQQRSDSNYDTRSVALVGTQSQGTRRPVTKLSLDTGENNTDEEEKSELKQPLLVNDHLPTIGGEV